MNGNFNFSFIKIGLIVNVNYFYLVVDVLCKGCLR